MSGGAFRLLVGEQEILNHVIAASDVRMLFLLTKLAL
jgi:hypothetical protein